MPNKKDYPHIKISNVLRHKVLDAAREQRKNSTEEVDGPVHDFQVHADKERQTMLETLGLNILRVRVEHVERDLPAVLDRIRMKIGELKSSHDNSPFPALGEGQGGDS
jgi:very-short-patch-repair endonuclease